MNGGFWHSIRKWADPVGTLAAGILLAGCGQQAQSPAPAPTAEVRGDPIRGEPIAAPTSAASTTSTGAVVASAGAVDVKVAVEVKVGGEASKVVVTTEGTPTAGNGPGALTAVGNGKATAAAAAVNIAETAKPGTGTAANPLTVGFDKLASFAYSLPDGPIDTNLVAQTTTTNQIPSTIKALNDQFISLKGFMLPLKVEKGLVTELLIMRDQSMCCYGTVPKINEWVSVKMVGEGVKPVMDQAVTLFGKLKVGEMYENGYLVGIYALDGERMAGPLDL